MNKIDGLTFEKKKLLELKLKEAANKLNAFPLSYSQQRLWFMYEMDKQSNMYNIPAALRLKGKLNVNAIEQSINKIIERHEILRTNFLSLGGKPLQVIQKELKINLHQIDLSFEADEDKKKNLDEIINLEISKPFDLSKAPLLKIILIKLDDNEQILFFNLHHIIADGWSIGIFVKEFSFFYNKFCKNLEADLPLPAIQYVDYSSWQRKWIESDKKVLQLNYWKEKLKNPAELEIPTDNPRPQLKRFKGEIYQSKINEARFSRILEFSQKNNVTPFMFLLAVLKLFLFRYCGQDDLLIGTPIANRNKNETESLIGFFVNTLVLRTTILSSWTFNDLLKDVRLTALSAFENQDLPFEMLVEELNPERSVSRTPLFQVMFIFQNASVKKLILQDLEIEPYEVKTGSSMFDLTFTFAPNDKNELISAIEYDTDLFNEDTIHHIQKLFDSLIDQVINDRDKNLLDYNFLPDEQKKVIELANNNDCEFPRPDSIHYLFEQQAEINSSATAVVDENRRISYGELNQKANSLAHRLIESGISSEKIVGIFLNKSVETIIALLGVLKAGAAYLPIDPDYPDDRISHMITDSKAGLIISSAKNANRLKEYSIQVINLDQIDNLKVSNPEIKISSLNAAYVIYTSGSTGKSKGTVVEHRALINQYFAWEREYRLKTECRNHIQMASFSFDVFTGDWVRALCSGGKLVIASRDVLLDGQKFFNLLKDEDVHFGDFVPAVFRNLLQYLEKANRKIDFFKVLVIGADIWYVHEYRKILGFIGSKTRIMNSFGLTEATIDSSFYEKENFDLHDSRMVPIGRPYSNTKLYVLDKNLNILPFGVIGELYVGGAALSRGYLNRPDLTAEKFIPDPFNNFPGARLYKSGDGAKYLSDGNIEFIGRLDNQVKLRGFRIELGEIESALKDHESISQAVVVTKPDTKGEKHLAAYFVLKLNNSVNEAQLKKFLSEKLPAYMVPSIFIELDKIPLTPNGKIDRKALPDPDFSKIESELSGSIVKPSSDSENKILQIWTEILGHKNIGVTHNFFDLGGHSLLATQIVSRIQTEFNIDFPLKTIFEKPTIRQLAAEVDESFSTPVKSESLKINRYGRNNSLPLSFAQERLWFLTQLEPESPFYNIPEAYIITGNVDLDFLEKSINLVIERHEILRAGIIANEGIPSLIIKDKINFKLQRKDVSHLPVETREMKVREIAENVFKQLIQLHEPPLFNITAVKIDNEKFALILSVHHIIYDDWSGKIFLGEISKEYFSLIHNEPADLNELPIQYPDYAVWQRERLKGEKLDEEINFWKKNLENIPALLELPWDKMRPAIQTFNGNYITFEIPEKTKEKLKEFCSAENVTPFMVLISVFQALMQRLSGQNTICTGTPIANRNHPELESLIGFFVNTLVLRTDFNSQLTFRSLIRKTNEYLVSAYSHQELPFEKIVEAINPERNLSHSPLFQVMFVLQNTPSKHNRFAETFRIEPLSFNSSTSKFDLTFFMLEDGNKLIGAAEYNTDLFEADTIQRMINHFTNLLDKMIAQPETPIHLIEFINPDEKKYLTETINENPGSDLLKKPVHIEISERSQMFNSSIAMELEGKTLTYRQLNIEANKLANYLLTKGAKPETVIGISLNRSFELIISVLAVLKTGSAYLPLDPSYPKDRLRFMAEDANVKFILADNRTRILFDQSEKEIEIIDLDESKTEISFHRDSDPKAEVFEDNLCYIIYTSGSTGKPKGTAITHKGLLNYLNWCLSEYPLEKGTGSLFHSTLSFDATITAIFPVLLSGKRIKLIPEGTEIENISEALINEGDFSLIKITPSHLDMLNLQLPENPGKILSHSLVIGGENLNSSQIKYWQKNQTNTLLFNEYGPTETVVGCVVYEASGFSTSGSVPIGKVIPGIKVYVLDENLFTVPVGVKGELFISGEGVARGYVNKPDITAEKFLPDPFSEISGSRMYRTGDVVRILKDGNIEFIGRADDQVKIRGYRIELSEVENVLLECRGVQEAAVTLNDEGVNKKIVAYVSKKSSDEDLSLEKLREELKIRLPEYLVPSQINFMKELPKTHSGKIDKRKLKEIRIQNDSAEIEISLPVTDEEKTLHSVWKEVLRIENIGIKNNFFESGGDSILAIQVVAKAASRGLKISPLQLFQYQTIERLARVAEKIKVKESNYETVTGKIELTPVQKWFFDQNFENPNHYNQSALFVVKMNLEEAQILNVLEILVMHHDMLRAKFIKHENIIEQVVGQEFNSDCLSYFDFSHLNDTEFSDEVKKTCDILQRSFDLSKTPLFRAAYFSSGSENNNRLFFTFHHLIIDAVSWRIILEDLISMFMSSEIHNEFRLPSKTCSYKKWSETLQSIAQSESLNDEIDFWSGLRKRKHFGIEKDYDGENLNKFNEQLVISIPASETESLLIKAAPEFNLKVDELLIGCLMRAYNKWTGRRTLLLDLESHGREMNYAEIDVKRTVGWFTSIYPVYLDLKKEVQIVDQVNLIKEQLRAVQNNGIGFGLLKYIKGIQELKEIPLAEIIFNHLGSFDNITDGGIFSAAKESVGPQVDENNHREHLIEVTSLISEGQLNIQFSYSKKVIKENRIIELANHYKDTLMEFLNLYNEGGVKKVIASDYKLKKITDQQLDKALKKLLK